VYAILPGVTATLAVSFTEILRDFGYAGLAALMLAETLFPPIPSEAVLPLAGYLVEQDDLALLPTLLAATAGAMTGAIVLYELARAGGRPFAERFLRRARIDVRRLDAAEAWFARRGPVVVLAARCVPGVRSVIALPAGALRMPRWQYVGFSLVGTLLWNSLLLGAGYLLGAEWERVEDVIAPLSKPLLALVVLGAAGAGVWWLRRARRADAPAAD
jgi:membrane protein DedA with SNARE-associated domain